MSKYICLSENETGEGIEIPINEQGTIALSTIAAQFHGACGIKYRSETGNFRAVPIVDGNFEPPTDLKSTNFVVVFPKVIPEQVSSDIVSSNECTDLIVLGLPWKCTLDQMKDYFKAFGDLAISEIKLNIETGLSRGYGFIRFTDLNSQLKCLTQRHMIEGKWCDVKIPNSSVNADAYADKYCSRIFVGNITEHVSSDAIRVHFSKYGEVVDVYYPKPFRAFTFVTFKNSEIARSLIGQDHVISGQICKVSAASPKHRVAQEKPNSDHNHGAHGHSLSERCRERDNDNNRRDNKRFAGGDSSSNTPIVNASSMASTNSMLSSVNGWNMLNLSQGLEQPQYSPAEQNRMAYSKYGLNEQMYPSQMYPSQDAYRLAYHQYQQQLYQNQYTEPNAYPEQRHSNN